MKVLQVIDTLNVGGAERLTVTLSNLLYNRGIDISVLLLLEDGELLKNLNSNINVLRLNRTKKFSISKIKMLANIISNFDVIHVHLKHNYRYVKLVSDIFCKKKIILHDHSHNHSINKSLVSKVKDSFFKTILKPEIYIGVSKENCDWAKNILKIEPSKIYKLSNIIIKEDTKPNPSKKDIILVSNISRIKNISFALKVIEKLNYNLHIYGNIYDTTYMHEINEEIERLNLKNKVKIISNVINIQQILPNYKFALLTSLKETGPIVIIEYLAQSIPFLTYKTGEVIDLIYNDLNLNIINNFDEIKWVERINEIMNLPTSNFSTIYSKYFDPDNYIEKCLNIYKCAQVY